jgi:hypothetical protein
MAYTLTGPQPYTARQRLSTIGEALGSELHFNQPTEQQAPRLSGVVDIFSQVRA